MAASTVTVRSGDIFWQQVRSGAAEGYGEETRMPGTVCSVAGGHARVLRAGSRPERRLGALTAGRPDDDRHLQRRRDDTGDVAAALTADGDAHHAREARGAPQVRGFHRAADGLRCDEVEARAADLPPGARGDGVRARRQRHVEEHPVGRVAQHQAEPVGDRIERWVGGRRYVALHRQPIVAGRGAVTSDLEAWLGEGDAVDAGVEHVAHAVTVDVDQGVGAGAARVAGVGGADLAVVGARRAGGEGRVRAAAVGVAGVRRAEEAVVRARRAGDDRGVRARPRAVARVGGAGVLVGEAAGPRAQRRRRARAGRIAHVVGARVRVGGAAAAARAEVTGGVAAGVSGLGAVVAFLGRADDVITAAVPPRADAAPATVGGRGAARDAGAGVGAARTARHRVADVAVERVAVGARSSEEPHRARRKWTVHLERAGLRIDEAAERLSGHRYGEGRAVLG